MRVEQWFGRVNALVLALVLGCWAFCPAAAQAATALSANNFLNSLGANINGGPNDYNPASLASCCSYLGIRWLRLQEDDSMSNYVTAHNDDTNLKFSLGPGSGGSNVTDLISNGTTLANAGALLAFEGPNEPNNWGITYNGQSGWTAVAQFQTAMYTTVKANSTLKNYPVFGVSEDGAETTNVGLQYATIPSGASTTLPVGTQYFDYANPHNYVECNGGYVNNVAWNMMNPTFSGYGDALYGEYGNTWSKHYAGYSNAQLVTLPRVTTETGVEIGSTSNGHTYTADDQAKMLMNTYLDAFSQNVSYTSMFKLADMGNGDGTGWGFLGSTWGSYRESGTDLHNLTTILTDNTTGTPGTLNYSIASEPSTMHDMLLQKSSGTFELVVWSELTTGSSTVTVNLGGTYSNVNIYDPTVGTSAIQTLSGVSSVSLTLSDHAQIIELPATVIPEPATLALLAFGGLLVLPRRRRG